MQEIRDVWAGNLDEEMARIRELVLKYPFIAMVSALRPLATLAHRLWLNGL